MSARQKLAFDHSGSSFDTLLKEEGILDEVEAVAIRRVATWQEAGQHQDKRPLSLSDPKD